MTGRSESRPNDHLLDSWAGTSACGPASPPSPKQIKVQMLQRTIILFSHCLEGAGETAQIWEIVADKVPV